MASNESSQYNQQVRIQQLKSIYAEIVQLRTAMATYRTLNMAGASNEALITNLNLLNSTSVKLTEKTIQYENIALAIYGNKNFRSELGHN